MTVFEGLKIYLNLKMLKINFIFQKNSQKIKNTSNTVLKVGKLYLSKKQTHSRARLTFCRPKSLIYGTCCSYRRSINSPIEEQHDKHWNIKAPKCTINNISGVICKLTLPWTFFGSSSWHCC